MTRGSMTVLFEEDPVHVFLTREAFGYTARIEGTKDGATEHYDAIDRVKLNGREIALSPDPDPLRLQDVGVVISDECDYELRVMEVYQ